MSAPFSGHLYIRMNDYGKFQGVYKMLLGNFSSIASVTGRQFSSLDSNTE
jgi:hypothetical protein